MQSENPYENLSLEDRIKIEAQDFGANLLASIIEPNLKAVSAWVWRTAKFLKLHRNLGFKFLTEIQTGLQTDLEISDDAEVDEDGEI